MKKGEMNMKIYRVITNTFTTARVRLGLTPTALEDIYYDMGYISLLGNASLHKCNNIYENISGDGKYFFLFPEDAILIGNQLLKIYHGLFYIDTFLVVEYDVPNELILKNIGYGDYSNYWSRKILETFIEKEDLGNKIITTDSIGIERKTQSFINRFSDSIQKICDFNIYKQYDFDYYSKVFETDDLNEIKNDRDKISEMLLNSELYRNFINKNLTLVETPYTTGKIIYVNRNYIKKAYGEMHNATKYFKQMDIRFDISNKQDGYKNKLLSYVDAEKNIEKVEQMLISRSYM